MDFADELKNTIEDAVFRLSEHRCRLVELFHDGELSLTIVSFEKGVNWDQFCESLQQFIENLEAIIGCGIEVDFFFDSCQLHSNMLDEKFNGNDDL